MRVVEMSNHLLTELGVGLAWHGNTVKSFSASPTAPRSRRAHCGVGGGNMIAGGFSVITCGTWSELVEGRGVSQEATRGERAVFAKARSKTDGHEIVLKGNRVLTPGVLRRWYGMSKATSRQRAEIVNSLSERERQGSAKGCRRLKSPKIK